MDVRPRGKRLIQDVLSHPGLYKGVKMARMVDGISQSKLLQLKNGWTVQNQPFFKNFNGAVGVNYKTVSIVNDIPQVRANHVVDELVGIGASKTARTGHSFVHASAGEP